MENNNASKCLSFRNKYPVFIYKDFSYSINELSIDMEFHFSIPGLSEFHPHWSISRISKDTADIDLEKVQALVFSLGMVELISYWKTVCSPDIHIQCGHLDNSQINWWKKLYIKGLGEFFYTNGISVDDNFTDIKCDNSTTEVEKVLRKESSTNEGATNPKVLVPIGGGKDSAVTLELLESIADRYCYIINPREATTDTVKVSSVSSDHTIIAKRTLDGNMLELNKKGFLNGHTPFSALVAFSSVIAAHVNGLSYVALSNESSANESTVMDSDVNHQYSKSYEFEKDFIFYEDNYIRSNVKYFSLLRPLTEMQIARIFSHHEKYHPIFRSCNVGSKSDIWCGNCAKCLFVFIILSPFLEYQNLLNIFGKDLLNDAKLQPIFDQLIGIEPEKPFECVGSRDEVNAALQELLRQYKSKECSMPYLLQYYDGLSIAEKLSVGEYCTLFDSDNSIPEIFLKPLKQSVLKGDV